MRLIRFRRMAWVPLLLMLPACTSLSRIFPGTVETQVQRAKEQVFPAIVHIRPVKEVFRRGRRELMAVTGSGVIFRPDGYVITNEHVAGKANRVSCTLSNLEEVSAEVVGTDPETDIAVLKLNMDEISGPLRYARLGDSDRIRDGETVLAFGSPLGFERTVSRGVVSSKDRYLGGPYSEVSAYNLWIQTDAAINRGNSGGPLVNLRGEVIGINSLAVIAGENIAFAIPINLVKEVVPQLIEHGKVERSDLGLRFQQLQFLEDYFGIAMDQGVVISSIDRGSPAEEAGVLAGDILLAYNGAPIRARFIQELPAIRKMIADTPPGQEITLDVMRQGERQEIRMTTRIKDRREGEEFQVDEWGFSVREVTDRIAQLAKMEEKSGVVVTGIRPGSPGANAKLRGGDIIRLVDGEKVKDLEHFEELYGQKVAERQELALFEVTYGAFHRYVLIRTLYGAAEPFSAEVLETPKG